MSTTTLIPRAADDCDLVAAFAALRASSVPLRPGFVAELRARLVAEIAHIHQEGTEVSSYATTRVDVAPGAGLRGVHRPAEGEYQST
jgi:hypothetical protein